MKNKTNDLNLTRFLPKVGDIVIVKYFLNIKGKFFSYFKIQVFLGRCISVKKKGLCCSFCLQNFIGKNSIEFSFVLNSPLIKSIHILPRLRKYKQFKYRSKLYYLRRKKFSK